MKTAIPAGMAVFAYKKAARSGGGVVALQQVQSLVLCAVVSDAQGLDAVILHGGQHHDLDGK